LFFLFCCLLFCFVCDLSCCLCWLHFFFLVPALYFRFPPSLGMSYALIELL
jgi:hypothetical protein